MIDGTRLLKVALMNPYAPPRNVVRAGPAQVISPAGEATPTRCKDDSGLSLAAHLGGSRPKIRSFIDADRPSGQSGSLAGASKPSIQMLLAFGVR